MAREPWLLHPLHHTHSFTQTSINLELPKRNSGRDDEFADPAMALAMHGSMAACLLYVGELWTGS